MAATVVRVQLGWIAGAGLASLALRGALVGSLTAPFYDRGQTLMVSLPGLLDWFAIGMALAVLRAELEAGRASGFPLAALRRRAWVCVVLAFATFMVAIPEQYGDIFLPWYGVATHLAIGVGSGLLVLAVIVPGYPASRPWPLRVLASPIAAWVGTHLLRHLPLAFAGAPVDRARGAATPGVSVRRRVSGSSGSLRWLPRSSSVPRAST